MIPEEKHVRSVLVEVHAERTSQNGKWGEQNHPNGTGTPYARGVARMLRDACEMAAANGTTSWEKILTEEVGEVLGETDDELVRAELVQVAAVAVAWIQSIDRRRARDGQVVDAVAAPGV